MNASLVSAIAASCAVAVSLTNIAFTARFGQRLDDQRWKREHLPELIAQFNVAAFEYERDIWETDWNEDPAEPFESVAMARYRAASTLLEQLEVFASAQTLSAARRVMQSINMMNSSVASRVAKGTWDLANRDWTAYWDYAEAAHEFLVVARRDLGLDRPPVPPGLQSHRDRYSGLKGD